MKEWAQKNPYLSNQTNTNSSLANLLQVAFPEEDFEEVTLTKKKAMNAKASEKKTQLNKLMGKKT